MRSRTSILVLLLLILTSCSHQDDRSLSDAELIDKIADAAAPEQSVLDLGKVASFPWDSLLIVNPFSKLDVISADLNVDLSSAKQTGIDQRDDINLLMFYADGQLVRMIEFPRVSGDFVDTTIQFVARERAKFRITETDRLDMSGHKSIELRRD